MKKRFRLFLYVLGGFVFLSIATLAIHLAAVKSGKSYERKNLQMARIDFELPIDSSMAFSARNRVKMTTGVQHAYVNIPAGILVYAFDPEKVDAQTVYSTMMASGKYTATAYRPSAELAAKGCPIGADDDTVLGRIMTAFK